MDATGQAEQLVRAVYPALAAGDRDTLASLLADDFEAAFCAGLPHGLGGVRRGAGTAITEGWWAIGRAFAVLAEIEEVVPCEDGRVLVRGTYRGSERATGRVVEAEFMHLWTAAGGRLTHLRQLTDTAAWAG